MRKRIIAAAASAAAIAGGVLIAGGESASADSYTFYQRSATFSVSGGASNTHAVTCDTSSDKVTGGGVEFDNPGGTPNPNTYMRVIVSAPTTDAGKGAWWAGYYNANSGGASITGRVYVICASVV